MRGKVDCQIGRIFDVACLQGDLRLWPVIIAQKCQTGRAIAARQCQCGLKAGLDRLAKDRRAQHDTLGRDLANFNGDRQIGQGKTRCLGTGQGVRIGQRLAFQHDLLRGQRVDGHMAGQQGCAVPIERHFLER